jgi:hypothetical protein
LLRKRHYSTGLSVLDLLRDRQHDGAALLCVFDLIELHGSVLRRSSGGKINSFAVLLAGDFRWHQPEETAAKEHERARPFGGIRDYKPREFEKDLDANPAYPSDRREFRKTRSIRHQTFWVPPGAANKGEHKDSQSIRA